MPSCGVFWEIRRHRLEKEVQRWHTNWRWNRAHLPVTTLVDRRQREQPTRLCMRCAIGVPHGAGRQHQRQTGMGEVQP